MKASHRTALSLLLTIIIFSIISVAAVFGGFKYVEMHYYQPRVVNNIMKILDAIGSAYDSYADGMIESFASYALDDRARTFIERNVTVTDIETREQMTGELMEKNGGLEGIRLVESDGNHIHYSTFASDILSKSEELVSYRNYSDLNELPVQFISTSDNGEYAGTKESLSERAGIYFDAVRDRIIFSLPYFDKYTAYRGTLIFYVEPNDFLSRIIAENIVPLNTRLKVVAPMDSDVNTQETGNSGFVFGMPNVGRDMLSEAVIRTWGAKRYGSEPVVQTDENVLVLVTGVNCKYGKIGWICRDSEFSFSKTEKVLLLLCLFITLFLIIFILFNFRHDDSVIIRERVHKFEMALFREYLEHRDTDDWKSLEKEISLRKHDVNAEIVKSLGITGKKHSKEISEALDRSWNDFMHLVSGGYRSTLENLAAPVIDGENDSAKGSASGDFPVVVEEVEELEEIEEAEGLEAVDEGGLEELAELDDAEPAGDLEEVVDGGVKTEGSLSDDIEDDGLEELVEVDDDGEDLDVPEVGGFDDPLADEENLSDSSVSYDLEEISPEEEAQLAQMEARKKQDSTWQNYFLENDEIGTPRFDDLDDDDNGSWKENGSGR